MKLPSTLWAAKWQHRQSTCLACATRDPRPHCGRLLPRAYSNALWSVRGLARNWAQAAHRAKHRGRQPALVAAEGPR